MRLLQSHLNGPEALAISKAIQGVTARRLPDHELAQDAHTAAALAESLSLAESNLCFSSDGCRILFVVKENLSSREIKALKRAIEEGNFVLAHRLFKAASFPVIVTQAIIFDNPHDPFWLETFPNITSPDRILFQRLYTGTNLAVCYHFFDQENYLLCRAGFFSPWIGDLSGVLREAAAHLQSIAPATRDFPTAVCQYHLHRGQVSAHAISHNEEAAC